jgi:hypothetical protein
MQMQKILPSKIVTVVHCLAGLGTLLNAGTLLVEWLWRGSIWVVRGLMTACGNGSLVCSIEV